VNDRQRKTLEAIFERPTRATIEWVDIESLFRAVGAEISEGSGSMVRISLGGIRYVYHRPHPDKHTIKGAIESVREQLIKAGVLP
jgi:hypothetical protein